MSTIREEAGPPLIVEERDDGVTLLTLNRPDAANAVSFDMWALFAAALDRIEASGSPPRALVIAGSKKIFSTGGDMKTPPARGNGALAPATRLEIGQRVIARLRALPTPVIAAIEGGAYGIGWSLALACDIVLASETAKFAAPFVSMGLTPDGGAAWLLAKQIGRYRASELLITGRTLSAPEAERLGLVTRLLPPGTVLDVALEMAATIGGGNRQAVELTKRLLQGADGGGDLASSHALELAYCAILQHGPELARAREAFLSRSKPKGA